MQKGSLFFEENLFIEMSWPSRILLIVLLLSYGFRHGKEEDVLSPMELQFFDDYFVLYQPKATLAEISFEKYMKKCSTMILPNVPICLSLSGFTFMEGPPSSGTNMTKVSKNRRSWRKGGIFSAGASTLLFRVRRFRAFHAISLEHTGATSSNHTGAGSNNHLTRVN